MAATEVDKDWFLDRLRDQNKSVRSLARHLKIDPSAASRTLSGARRMKIEEAQEIATFLAAPVNEVLKHAGVSLDLDGYPTKILLAAIIGEDGVVQRLTEPRPLPQAVIDRAQAAISRSTNKQIVAAQIRAASGPLSVLDDAVVLFSYTDHVDNSSIGALSICRTIKGDQVLCRIERARKTGEAKVVRVNGETHELDLQTATPVLALIP